MNILAQKWSQIRMNDHFNSGSLNKIAKLLIK